MPATRKHLLGGVAVCAGITLSAFSVAWACTPGGGINVNPGSGVAGSSALVSGSGYEATAEAAGAGAAAGPVEIRWNSMSGTVLATASGPSFSTSVTIPASAGERTRNRTYYIVAVQKLSSGQVRTASAPFTVPATEPETQTQAAPQPEAQPQPVAQQDPAPATAGTDAATAAPSVATGAPAAKAPAPATTARRPSSRVAPAATRTGSASAPSANTSPVPVAQAPEPVAAPAAAPAAEVAEQPSGRTVSSDVWSGFSDGTTSRGPSLVQAPSATNGSGDSGLGLGLVALGTVGLLGGTVVGLRSRRRLVPVETSADTE